MSVELVYAVGIIIHWTDMSYLDAVQDTLVHQPVLPRPPKQSPHQTPLHLARPSPCLFFPLLLHPLQRRLLGLCFLGSELGGPLRASCLEYILSVELLTDKQSKTHPFVAEKRRGRIQEVLIQSTMLHTRPISSPCFCTTRETHLVYRPQRSRRHLDLYTSFQQIRNQGFRMDVWKPCATGFCE